MNFAPFEKFARVTDRLIADNPLALNHIFDIASDSPEAIKKPLRLYQIIVHQIRLLIQA